MIEPKACFLFSHELLPQITYYETLFLHTLTQSKLLLHPIERSTSEFLDVNEAVVRALDQNLALRVEGVEVVLAQQDVIIEEAAFDTQFFASGTQRGSRSPGYNGFEGDSTHNSLVRTGISKRLNSGGDLQLSSNYIRNST